MTDQATVNFSERYLLPGVFNQCSSGIHKNYFVFAYQRVGLKIFLLSFIFEKRCLFYNLEMASACSVLFEWICRLAILNRQGSWPYTRNCSGVINDGGMRWCSWLRNCTASWKVVGLIADGVIEFFH